MGRKDLESRKDYDKERYLSKKQYFKDNMRRWKDLNPTWYMWRAAKIRAKEKGLPFNIEPSDIKIPELCPILQIPVKFGKMHVRDHSPSLDRIIPELGYIVGNIQVISNKANTMKNSASKEDLIKFADWIYKYIKSEDKL